MSQSSKQIHLSDELQAKPVIAGVLTRSLAGLYDLLLILALIFFAGVILIVIGTQLYPAINGKADTLPLTYRYFVIFPIYLFMVYGFYAIFWHKAGQTLGMQTWRLKTIYHNGQYLTYTQSFARFASACVLPCICGAMAYALYRSPIPLVFSMIVGFLFNYAFIWFNSRRLAVHDILSRSVTVQMPPKPKQLK